MNRDVSSVRQKHFSAIFCIMNIRLAGKLREKQSQNVEISLLLLPKIRQSEGKTQENSMTKVGRW